MTKQDLEQYLSMLSREKLAYRHSPEDIEQINKMAEVAIYKFHNPPEIDCHYSPEDGCKCPIHN